MGETRCPWATVNPLMTAYHDEEWGVPVSDDDKLFEFMVLDAFQAGLSWAIILGKREAFREAFDGFDAERVARFPKRRVTQLLRNPGIVRNRLKIEATVGNAKAFVRLREELGSCSAFLWSFVDGRPRQNAWKTPRQVPPRTVQSDRMSAALKTRGFKFVGSTICYAFMQAAGMVNDHLVGCPRHSEVQELAARGA